MTAPRKKGSFYRPPNYAERNEAESANVKRESLLIAFDTVWAELFTSPVHLDSLLSRQTPKLKSLLAQILPPILLKPVSLCEHFGVGVRPGEPWSLDLGQKAAWRPARLLAERLHEALEGGGVRLEEVTASLQRAGITAEIDFPPLMIQEWKAAWGDERTTALASALSLQPPLTLRTCFKVGAKEVARYLREDAKVPVKVSVGSSSPAAVVLGGYTPVFHNELFEKGFYEIQDEGSQVMAWYAIWPEVFSKILSETPALEIRAKIPDFSALPAVPPLTVVDACAGAGGKSLALGDALQGKGRLYAYDISAKKLEGLRRRATRAGLTNIQTLAIEPENTEAQLKKFEATADLVLVDAPCSGWGVLRRNPDIKWRENEERSNDLPLIQSRILHAYSALVKPGGRLVYGTCTFKRSETEGVVKDFLTAHPEFTPLKGGFFGPGSSDGFFMQGFVRALTPALDKTAKSSS